MTRRARVWVQGLRGAVILGSVAGIVAALFVRYFPSNAQDPSDPPLTTITHSWTTAGAIGVVVAVVLGIVIFLVALADEGDDGGADADQREP